LKLGHANCPVLSIASLEALGSAIDFFGTRLAIEFCRRLKMKKFAQQLLDGFLKHDLLTLAAALAFYTALSIAPLLLITLSVVGVLGVSSQAQMLNQIRELVGEQAGLAVTAIVEGAQQKKHLSGLAGLIGISVLFFSASGVFAQLQSSLNVIWEVEAKANSEVRSWIRKRILSIGMVMTLGFLSMISLIVSTIIAFLFTQKGFGWKLANVSVSITIFCVLFAAIFRYLPDIKLSWRGAFVGGLSTAILFAAGKSLIGLYLGQTAVGSAYGAAGSLVVLLSWIYYSSLIVFTGAEITRILNEENRTELLAEPSRNKKSNKLQMAHEMQGKL
jgi:membrane protein